jgi:hypothetical protein
MNAPTYSGGEIEAPSMRPSAHGTMHKWRGVERSRRLSQLPKLARSKQLHEVVAHRRSTASLRRTALHNRCQCAPNSVPRRLPRPHSARSGASARPHSRHHLRTTAIITQLLSHTLLVCTIRSWKGGIHRSQSLSTKPSKPHTSRIFHLRNLDAHDGCAMTGSPCSL